MVGKLVKSKAGHDKDCIYIVLETDSKYAYLADGKIRTLDNLKKKNLKHLNVINVITDVGNKIISKEKISNEEIKRTIKLYLSGE